MSGLLSNLPFIRKEQRPLPAIVPTDEVIPVHLFDDSAAARGIVLVWTFKFDEILDPKSLHAALSELLQMDGWRRFSGRFRYRSDNTLEIHVPTACTAERPAVQFSEERHKSPMMEHPLASKLPRPTGKVATYPGAKEFCSLGLGPETPRNIDDFVFLSKPQFCLHVHTFTDGTIVSITHSHISTDLMGFASLLEAWSLVLAGKAEAVLPMVGYDEDAFDGLWHTKPKQEHVLADKMLSGWRFKYWGVRSLYESWRGGDVQSRTLCIPKRTMDKIMAEARSHIQAEAVTSPSSIQNFVSEGDVLTAVACQMLARYQGPNAKRAMATIMAVDPRSRVQSIFRQDRAYVQNSPTNVFFFCRAEEALKLSLGRLAVLVRQAITTQASEEQLKASTYLSAESMRGSKMPVIFGDKDMTAQFMSNWTKGNLADKIDFSPAIVRDAAPGPSRRKRGHPAYYQASDPSHSTVSVISSVFVVMGKDSDDNTWFSVSWPKRMWSDFMQFLEVFA